jgi:DNA-binding MarR family transcriptional regulator
MSDVSTDPPTKEPLGAWLALLQAQAAVTDAVEAELVAGSELPLAWHEVLVRLARAGGRMRMRELAQAVLLSKSGLTRLADRMEEAGLLERSACATDRRGTFAVLTKSGRSVLRRSTPVFRRAVEANLADHLTADELTSLRSLLEKVAQGSGRADEVCDPSDLGEPRGATKTPA